MLPAAASATAAATAAAAAADQRPLALSLLPTPHPCFLSPPCSEQKVLVLDSIRAARQRLLALALLALLASASTIALAVHVARRSVAAAAGHVLVIDAGSSGTRMYAYSWRPGEAGSGGAPRLQAVPSTAAPHKVPRRALPDKRAYQRVETEPGLDAFADDAPGLQAKALGG